MAARALALQCAAVAACSALGAPAWHCGAPLADGCDAEEGSLVQLGHRRHSPSPESSAAAWTFTKVVLRSANVSLTVWPPAQNSSAPAYYKSTRFDWSTMMSDLVAHGSSLFASSFWRSPQAAEGHPFLKIGVGKLIRHSQGEYSPFDPYEFAEFPRWSVSRTSESDITMVSEERLDDKWAYRLTKVASVNESGVTIQTTLENRGGRAFSTPHYSHSFFNVNRTVIGPPLCLRIVPDVHAAAEPGVGQGWASPSGDYFAPTGAGELCAKTSVDGKVKMEFDGAANREADATWSALWDGKLLVTSVTEVVRGPLYGYNFYSEGTTASPEPMQMIALGPSENATWSRFLVVPKS